MKNLVRGMMVSGMVLVMAVVTGCGTTPGKVIASASTSVDHAMQGWMVYVVDGHATPAQEQAVRAAHLDYLAAEDAALAAYAGFAATGEASAWQRARDFLNGQQQALLALISSFQRGSP
jgi:predicted lipid-binding transport protein (Tim44 family)